MALPRPDGDLGLPTSPKSRNRVAEKLGDAGPGAGLVEYTAVAVITRVAPARKDAEGVKSKDGMNLHGWRAAWE